MRHPMSSRLRNEITRHPWFWWALAACGAPIIVMNLVPMFVGPVAPSFAQGFEGTKYPRAIAG